MPRRQAPAAAAKSVLGRPPTIGFDDVLETAVALAPHVGVDGLTMSLVADKLGVTAAALYHYVPSRKALIDLVLDQAFSRVEAPPADAGPWDERLRIFEGTVRRELRRLRWAMPQPVTDGEPPAYYQRFSGIVKEILSDTGADERDVMLAFTTVYAYMVGQLWYDSVVSTSDDQQAPELRSAAANASFGPDDVFEYGIEVVIEGLRHHLVPKRRGRRAR